MTKRGYMTSFVFSTGSGAPQTADTYDLDKDTYLEVTAEKDAAGHYLVKNVTNEIVPSGIESVEADNILSDCKADVSTTCPLRRVYISTEARRWL